MAKPIGLTDEEVAAQEAPVKGMTDEEVEAQVDDRATTPAMTTGDDEALKNAQTKESVLENFLTFFGNGGPTAALAGASAIGDPRKFRKGESAGDTYRRVRDETKRTMGQADRHGPQAEAFGVKFNPVALAGAMAPSLVAPNPTTMLGRLALAPAIGAEQAAFQSDADLTRGDVGGFSEDVGRGAGTGLLAGGVAEGLGVPIRAIARGAASRIGDAVATRAAKDVADVAGDVSKLEGQLGGESQKLSRFFENTQRAAGGGVAPAGQSPISPAVQQKAMLALTDPTAAAAQEKIIERSAAGIGTQTPKVSRLEAELAQAHAGADGEAASRTSNFFAKPTITTDVLPRVGRQLQNAAVGTVASIPGALGLGSEFGGKGVAAALISGASAGLAKGALSSARTTLENPRLQVGALESLIQASQAGRKALSGGARSAAAAGPELADEERRSVQAFLSGG